MDSGDAVDAIVFLDSGRYKRAQVLIPAARLGQAKYSIASTGSVLISGAELVLSPESGTQKLEDPESPNGGWERPLKLKPERYRWSVTDGELRLSGESGATVVYRCDG